MKLKPIDHDTQLIYQCPNCQSYHWKLVSEVTQPNQHIVCHCGTITEIFQLTNPKFTAKIKSGEPKRVVGLTEEEVNKAKVLVKAQGFSPYLVDSALDKHPTTYLELVRLAIAGANDGVGTTQKV